MLILKHRLRLKNFANVVADTLPERAKEKPLEVWFQDEARGSARDAHPHLGKARNPPACAPRHYKNPRLKGGGTRPPRAPPRHALQMELYIWRGLSRAGPQVLPYVNAEAMQLHLAEIAKAVSPGFHALLIMDARWHGAKALKVPDNITILKLPPYAPELNPMENVWAYLRANKLAITVFDTYDQILDKCKTLGTSLLMIQNA